MDEKKLDEYRAEVVKRTINIEWLMNAIISQHYLKKVIISFVLEVLYDHNFPFSLRRNIIEKIIEDMPREKIEQINRVNNIRNLFAHCDEKLICLSDENKTPVAPNPKDTSKNLNFEELYAEFSENANEVEKYLLEVYKSKGGEISDECPV